MKILPLSFFFLPKQRTLLLSSVVESRFHPSAWPYLDIFLLHSSCGPPSVHLCFLCHVRSSLPRASACVLAMKVGSVEAVHDPSPLLSPELAGRSKWLDSVCSFHTTAEFKLNTVWGQEGKPVIQVHVCPGSVYRPSSSVTA